jgi:hypothetical protein
VPSTYREGREVGLAVQAARGGGDLAGPGSAAAVGAGSRPLIGGAEVLNVLIGVQRTMAVCCPGCGLMSGCRAASLLASQQ